MRCDSGVDELECTAFQVGIYREGGDSRADVQPAVAANCTLARCVLLCQLVSLELPLSASSQFRSELCSSPDHSSSLNWKTVLTFISRTLLVIYRKLFRLVLCLQFLSVFFSTKVMQLFQSVRQISQQFVVL